MIPIYKPFIPKSSINYSNEAISSNWVSSQGKYTSLAEEKLAEINKVKHCVLTNNGTSATHLTAKALAKKYPKTKKVYVPSACYVAAYNCLLYDNVGWDIESVDLCDKTWNSNYNSFIPEENSALMVVHNLGNITNVIKLKEKFNIPIIEDNCEGFFGEYEGNPSGSKSLCSSLSFFGNKNITTGEGGAFLTNDSSLFHYISKIKCQGQTHKRYIHDELGYNYRMTNIQAAILLGQLEEIDKIKENKKRVFDLYRKELDKIDGVTNQHIEKDTTHSMWMIAARFSPKYFSLNELEEDLNTNRVETRRMFYPHTYHNHLKIKGDVEVSTKINKEVLMLPSYPELKDVEIKKICSIIANHQMNYKP
tara:strand:+ start:4136 stop:5227 length:1092 start_codon:yes stop_codon:yes gene_type:complete